ncbi:MAG: hypothetical protein WEA56_03610 [Balneolaceae bacterium]
MEQVNKNKVDLLVMHIGGWQLIFDLIAFVANGLVHEEDWNNTGSLFLRDDRSE